METSTNETNIPTIAERVAKGVTLLDAKGPKDWRSKINPRKLIMTSTESCVLGQLYGDYSKGVVELEIGEFKGCNCGVCLVNEQEPIEHGFQSFSSFGDYNELQTEWTRVLEPELNF